METYVSIYLVSAARGCRCRHRCAAAWEQGWSRKWTSACWTAGLSRRTVHPRLARSCIAYSSRYSIFALYLSTSSFYSHWEVKPFPLDPATCIRERNGTGYGVQTRRQTVGSWHDFTHAKLVTSILSEQEASEPGFT